MDTDLVKLLEILLPQNLGNNSIIIGNKNFWKLAKILIEGLIILQKINYIHCDLKSLNILVNLNNNNEEEEEVINNNLDFEFKIIDFTSAISINELNESTKLPDMTIQFTAPELINLNSKILPSINTDLFSVGLILLHASIGLPPYYNINTPYHLIDLVSNLKIFDILERESLNILNNNLIIKELLFMIIIKRSNLNDVIDYFNRFNEINCKI
ncbi:kinase activity protein [[Candida] boidinii]|nr:kinase activity protein [[Candida] boidinii]